MRATILSFTLIAVIANIPFAASAQDYPTRPITWTVSAAPGGMVDGSSRTIGRALSDILKVPVIIENKAGGGGIVAGASVANSRPDGYTALWGGSLAMITYPMLYKKPSYDPAKALLPVHGMFFMPMVIAVRSDAPFKNFNELIDYARKNPEKLNYPSLGKASAVHIQGELLQKAANIKLTHIPYRGSSLMITDMLGGLLDVLIDFPITTLPYIQAGKLIPVAVTSEERLKQLPETPTLSELGFKDASYVSWGVFAVASNTPPPIVTKLSAAFAESLRNELVQKYFDEQGATIMDGYTGGKLSEFLESERIRIKSVLDRAGISPE